MADVLSVVLRALSFVLLFQAAGVALFVAIFGRRLSATVELIRRGGQMAALVGIALVSGHYALEAARMANDLSGMFDASLQGMVWNSSSRAALIFRIVGLTLIAIGLRRSSALSLTTGVTGAALATFAFTLTGHISMNAHRGILTAVLMLHLLAVAFWFGALWPLYLVSRREAPRGAGEITEAFSALAVWVVPAILLAGLCMVAVLLPNLAALLEPYGELLIAKVAAFGLLMGLAALNKLRFGPAISRGEEPAIRGFQRTVAAEYVLIFGVVTATAVMTTFFSPE